MVLVSSMSSAVLEDWNRMSICCRWFQRDSWSSTHYWSIIMPLLAKPDHER